MKLLVVSHTPHHLNDDGIPAGWGATVRELDQLAGLFERMIHLAPLYPGPCPSSAQPYRAANIELRRLEPAGGERLVDKLQILGRAPVFYKELGRAYGEVDAVHIRAPANVALLSMARLSLKTPDKPHWIKYAGNWCPDDPTLDARSYRVQRRWLAKERPRTAVTVNGRLDSDGPHVHTFFNPCLSLEELRFAGESARRKSLDGPLELLFVGRLDGHKGSARALRVLAALRERSVAARLTLAGDGPKRREMEELADQLGLRDAVRFRGWLSREQLNELYALAHGLILPSDSEGWPKVLSEAMAHGALALTSRVSSVAQTLGELGGDETIGWTFAADDIAGFAGAAAELSASKEVFRARSLRAARAAEVFTYERYLQSVRRLFREHLGLELPAAGDFAV